MDQSQVRAGFSPRPQNDERNATERLNNFIYREWDIAPFGIVHL
jgi:hypothetical protein